MGVFAAVADTGSFALAAIKLNIANSVVSKRVKNLEAYLDGQPLIRNISLYAKFSKKFSPLMKNIFGFCQENQYIRKYDPPEKPKVARENFLIFY